MKYKILIIFIAIIVIVIVATLSIFSIWTDKIEKQERMELCEKLTRDNKVTVEQCVKYNKEHPRGNLAGFVEYYANEDMFNNALDSNVVCDVVICD